MEPFTVRRIFWQSTRLLWNRTADVGSKPPIDTFRFCMRSDDEDHTLVLCMAFYREHGCLRGPPSPSSC